MKFILTRLALFLLLAFLAQTGKAQVYTTEEGHAEVYGENAMTSYTGTSDQLEGKIDLRRNKVDFELELKTLKTGIAMRDRHMYETLEADTYPKAVFDGYLVDGHPEKGESGSVTVEGSFKIHGVRKRVEINGTMTRKDEKIEVEADFSIKITDYGMERPGYSFATVRDRHDIEIDAELKAR